jgi:thiamine pyrophosphokinase
MPAEEGVSNEVVAVVAGGNPPDPDALLHVPLGVPVVAADKGLEHAISLGLDVTIAVGDFDSASPDAVARAEAGETTVERHPEEKDATDLELALDRALSMSPERIVVLSGDGGRLDHLLSTLLVLGSSRYEHVEIDAFVGAARVFVVRGDRELRGEDGELVSLFALHGPTEDVQTEGLAYSLDGATLEPGSTLGVSNVLVGERARVSLGSGVLLAVFPGTRGEAT